MKKLSKEAAELLLTISNNEELQAFAKKLYPELSKKQLPKSWEELEYVQGYYVSPNSYVSNYDNIAANLSKNTFATKEQAEAAIAMAQLSQLMKVYNDGWEPNWSDDEIKYCIEFYHNKITKDTYRHTAKFLSFKDQETAVLFLENFTELIETAKPLL